jgi:primary-amine oxidase
MTPVPTTTVMPSTATTVVSNSAAKSVPQHPLDPLSSEEIAAVSLVVRQYMAQTIPEKVALKFITCYLLPPPKRTVLAHLGIPIDSNGTLEQPQGSIVRKAEVDVLELLSGNAYNLIVAWLDDKWVVESLDLLPEGTQPQISVEELIDCEVIVRNDERVRKLAKDVGILPEQLCCDGWAIGYDERFPQKQRLQQALVFARYSEHDNLYAHPMDFIPVIDSNKEKVIHIDFPTVYKKESDGSVKSSASTTIAPPLSEDALKSANRERIPPSRTSHDFLPDLIAQSNPNFKVRDDIKPLHILQPEGVSFKMNGHELEWQKWKMHVAFSHREGIVLSTITYNDDGQMRPIFYRLSLAEMVVPYGAPDWPHPRKFAFDSGEYGMGTMANELSLGCDCLGTIHYLVHYIRPYLLTPLSLSLSRDHLSVTMGKRSK